MDARFAPVDRGPTPPDDGSAAGSAFGSPRDAPPVAVQPELFEKMTPEKIRDFYGIPRHIRRARWPELYRLRYGAELIEDWARNGPQPQEFSVHAMRDVLLETEDRTPASRSEPDKFRIAFHWLLKRFCLFEYVRNPQEGPAYKMVSIAQEEAREGALPADLDDPFRQHLRGLAGEFRHFHRRDFELIRAAGDRRQPIEVLDRELDRQAETEEAEEAYANSQNIEAVHDYMWEAVRHAANGGEVRIAQMSDGSSQIRLKGSKQWIYPGAAQYRQPRERTEKYAQHQREGYKITAAHGGRIDRALREERQREERFQQLDALAEKNAATAAKQREIDDLRARARRATGFAAKKGRTL